MADKKKPSLAVVIGLGKSKKDPEPEYDKREGDEDGGEELDAAQALIDAVHSKDAEQVNEALKAHYDLCMRDHEDEE